MVRGLRVFAAGLARFFPGVVCGWLWLLVLSLVWLRFSLAFLESSCILLLQSPLPERCPASGLNVLAFRFFTLLSCPSSRVRAVLPSLLPPLLLPAPTRRSSLRACSLS